MKKILPKLILICIIYFPCFAQKNKFLIGLEKFGNNEYNRFHLGTGVGIEDFFIATPKVSYTFCYNKYFIQPYAGFQLSGMVPLTAIGLNKSAYTGVVLKYLSLELGKGNSFLKGESNYKNRILYNNYKIGLKTKLFWLKLGPTTIDYIIGNESFADRTLLRFNNRNWNIELTFDMKIIEERSQRKEERRKNKPKKKEEKYNPVF